MTIAVRYSLFFICALQVFLALACFLRLQFAVDLWVFPGSTPLTFIVIAAFFAAAAASTLWAATSENYGGLAGIGLDYVGSMLPIGVLALQKGSNSNSPAFTIFGLACVFGASFGIGMLVWSIRGPLNSTVPLPSVVRWSFVLFTTALLLVSVLLLFQVPNTLPWVITPDLSLVFGAMFFGSALYFAYGLLRPCWANAAGQLAGFLAYDVILIVPLLLRWPTTPPEFELSMNLYIAVVTYSGLLAMYYLFIHPPTRLWGKGLRSAPVS